MTTVLLTIAACAALAWLVGLVWFALSSRFAEPEPEDTSDWFV